MKIDLPQETTGIDVLRTRGTPIELIGSYLAAGDRRMANTAFRTAVLEYVYEKLAACERCKVRFVHADTLVGKPICTVESGVISEPILDHITATVMAVLEGVSANVFRTLHDKMSVIQHPNGTVHIGIIVDLFEFELEYDGKAVAAHATASASIRWIGDN